MILERGPVRITCPDGTAPAIIAEAVARWHDAHIAGATLRLPSTSVMIHVDRPADPTALASALRSLHAEFTQ